MSGDPTRKKNENKKAAKKIKTQTHRGEEEEEEAATEAKRQKKISSSSINWRCCWLLCFGWTRRREAKRQPGEEGSREGTLTWRKEEKRGEQSRQCLVFPSLLVPPLNANATLLLLPPCAAATAAYGL